MEELFITTAVIGTMELIKRLFDRDWRAASIIGASALIGLAVGAAGFAGATVVSGLVIGLGASGVVKVASKLRPVSNAK